MTVISYQYLPTPTPNTLSYYPPFRVDFYNPAGALALLAGHGLPVVSVTQEGRVDVSEQLTIQQEDYLNFIWSWFPYGVVFTEDDIPDPAAPKRSRRGSPAQIRDLYVS